MTIDTSPRAARTRRLALSVWIAATAPCVALAVASVVWSLVPGADLWPVDTVNLAEAAATRNTGEVVRQLARTTNGEQRQSVRAGLLDSSQVAQVTPLEAAVRIERADVIWTLLQYGPPTHDATLMALRCRVADDPELLAALSGGSTEAPACPPGQ